MKEKTKLVGGLHGGETQEIEEGEQVIEKGHFFVSSDGAIPVEIYRRSSPVRLSDSGEVEFDVVGSQAENAARSEG